MAANQERAFPAARPHAPRASAGLVLAVFLAASVIITVVMTGSFSARNGGVLYPLDDSYIHLALARTLAEHGVWGLLPSRPSAASSSPLWTILLAAAAKLMPGLSRTAFSWVPLVGNVAAGAALVVFWRRRLEGTAWPNLATLVLVAIVPLPAIAAIGMEHVLHVLLASVFAWSAAELIEQERRPDARQLATFGVLCGLTVATRYVSLALVAMAALLAGVRRRWIIVPVALVPAAAVILGFGIIWVRNGGWWVPNSFLLKTSIGQGASGSGLVSRVFAQVFESVANPIGALIVLLAAALAVLWLLLRHRAVPERSLLLLALASTGAQVLFGRLGWLFRYEAWLVALDALAILLAARRLFGGNRRLFGAALLVLLVVGTPRAAFAVMRTVQAAQDRVWEHFGPTQALRAYSGKPLLANDIGVISYYGTGLPIDIYGLADNETLRLKRQGQLDAHGLREFAASEGADIGEFQICWPDLRGKFPEGWLLVEAWTGPRNVVFNDLTVAFMAKDAAAAARLAAVLAHEQAPQAVRRFDASSPFVQAYNADADKRRAAVELCNRASLAVTGHPDPTASLPASPDIPPK